jgi:hypothetical protein
MADVCDVLERRKSEWAGRKLSGEETKSLRSDIGPAAKEEWLELLQEYPLVGTDLALTRQQDRNGRGVQAKVMGPKSIRQEAEGYPGKLAVKMGLLPFAWCLEGSGDPYFLRFDAEWQVVRVLHDACDVKRGVIDPKGVERVLPLSRFLALAQLPRGQNRQGRRGP